MTQLSHDFFELVARGGILMLPILITSVVAMGIIVERFLSLRRATVDTREFMAAMRQVLRRGQLQEAVEICEEVDVPVARIVKAGLLRYNRSREELREAIQEAGHLEVPRLERYLSGLATCANIAPLLGLLGTVQGMIKAFAQIQHKQGQVNPSDLAEGIGNALVTTATGLAVAIPILVVYNYLAARVDRMVFEMEVSSSELLELLTGPAARPAQGNRNAVRGTAQTQDPSDR